MTNIDLSNDDAIITCTVLVSTEGVGYTVIKLHPKDTYNWILIKESSKNQARNSGTIGFFPIGKAKDLKGAELFFRTSIDFSRFDKNHWEDHKNLLFIKFQLKSDKKKLASFTISKDDLMIFDDGQIVIAMSKKITL